jgi:hypothetical protein
MEELHVTAELVYDKSIAKDRHPLGMDRQERL